jgi:hypothetical protein
VKEKEAIPHIKEGVIMGWLGGDECFANTE